MKVSLKRRAQVCPFHQVLVMIISFILNHTSLNDVSVGAAAAGRNR